HDAGGVDIAIKEFAKTQGVEPDAARTVLSTMVTAQAAPLVQANPDLQEVANKIVEFLNSRGATLTITAAPKARVNLMQSVDLAKNDPMSLLPQFKFDAAVTK